MQQTTLLIATVLMLSYDATAQKLWFTVGSAGFSAGAVQYTSLGVDNNGTKYVAYTDAANSDKATVMKHDGTDWVVVGNAGFSAGAAYATSIALDNSGTPYITFQDYGNSTKATVMKYDGATWVNVGGPGFSTGAVHRTCIAIDNNGTPYVAYRDSANGAKATVMKYDGAAWVTVGSAGFSTGPVNELSFAINSSGTPYIMYTDLNNSNVGYVMKYDGTDWAMVRSPFSSHNIVLANIAFGKNDTPYIAYHYPLGWASLVKKFNGSRWELIGPEFSPNSVSSLAVDSSGIPYVVIKDIMSAKMSVLKYNGINNWVTVGKAGFSSGTIDYTSMVFDKNNVLNVAYRDGGNSNRASVMSYDCPPEAKVSICAVQAENKWVTIAWNSDVSNFVDSYLLYREDNGSFEKIVSVPGNYTSCTDYKALTSLQSYRYKLTYLDKCGKEISIDSSTAHSSIRLAFNYLIDDKASITWNSYEGVANPVYIIKRSNNGGVFTTIGNVAVTGNDTTYIDHSPPAGTNNYRVEVPTTNCGFGFTASNIVSSWHTGISDAPVKNDIVLSPNPAHNQLEIRATEDLVKIEIFGLTGQKMLTENRAGKKESIIDVSSLPSGMYFLRVNGIHNASFIKH